MVEGGRSRSLYMPLLINWADRGTTAEQTMSIYSVDHIGLVKNISAQFSLTGVIPLLASYCFSRDEEVRDQRNQSR